MRLFVSSGMQAKLSEYSGFHRTTGNEVCHYLGIPSIVVGAGTLLGALPLFRAGGFTVTVAELVAVGVVAYYLIAGRLLGAITSAILLLLVALGRALPLALGTVLFVAGWALQFVGHLGFEKSSPAFLRNLVHLLVGPAWLVERALGRLHLLRPAE